MGTRPAAVLLPCLALLAATAVGAAAAAPRGHDGADPDAPAVVVHALLATIADLPSIARASLIREVNDIWAREGVRVAWPGDPAEAHGHDVSLRVLVVQRESALNNSEHQWPVGELLLDQSAHAVAVASVDAAERVLAATTRVDEPTALHQRRLGVVLGRALAHEMGHYLLDTSGHARRGLMRARIDASDFADLRSGAFFLDAPAGQWIRDALPKSGPAQTRLARFVYAP